MGDAPTPKKSKGFIAKKKKVECPTMPKVETLPKAEDTSIFHFVGEDNLTPSTAAKQHLESPEKAEEQFTQPDVAKDG